MKKMVFILCLFLAVQSQAQIRKVSLQASGLTCSMCSKAVKTALEEVSFVDKVQVDIKNQQYNLTFKEGSVVDIDALGKAVEDAGFSVASLKVTADVPGTKLEKDKHLAIGGQTFHFLNAASQTVSGPVSFSVVDKGFVTEKSFKKYAALSKMACVQTGRMAACCPSAEAGAGARVYHVIL
jgi:copper chaperone CopZ